MTSAGGKRATSVASGALPALALLLSRAEHDLTARLADVVGREGGTVGEWRVLALLADGCGHPMSELARFAIARPATLTRIVDRMVADNLAYRSADPRDRRRVLVRMTPRGRALHDRLADRLRAAEGELLAGLDQREVDQLAGLLADVAAARR